MPAGDPLKEQAPADSIIFLPLMDTISFLSPIRTVIVSQGDASDFHHIQAVVGDLIAVRIQDVGVFLSPPS